MGDKTTDAAALGAHGATRLPSVEVDSYNLEIKDEDGFVGDKASRGAFHEMLEKWREPLRKLGADPLGEKSSDQIVEEQARQAPGRRRRRSRRHHSQRHRGVRKDARSVIKRFLKTSAGATPRPS